MIGADSAVSFANGRMPTIEQPFEKINIIDDNLIMVFTGPVGLGQRFSQIVTEANKQHLFSNAKSPLDIGKILSANAVRDFQSTGAPGDEYASMVAFHHGGMHYLVEFDDHGFQPELKSDQIWFCSQGCVQTLTDSFLAFLKSVFWPDSRPNLSDGIFAVKWTLDNAVAFNPGGVNLPVRIAVLHKDGSKFIARQLTDDELEEHIQNINGAKEALVNFKKSHSVNIHIDVPAVQKPATSLISSQIDSSLQNRAGIPSVGELLNRDSTTKPIIPGLNPSTTDNSSQNKARDKHKPNRH